MLVLSGSGPEGLDSTRNRSWVTRKQALALHTYWDIIV